MNKHDLDNLQFIMALNNDDFDKWMDELTSDDMDYAMELLRAARQENMMLEQELLDQIEDVSLAQTVLKKYTLK